MKPSPAVPPNHLLFMIVTAVLWEWPLVKTRRVEYRPANHSELLDVTKIQHDSGGFLPVAVRKLALVASH